MKKDPYERENIVNQKTKLSANLLIELNDWKSKMGPKNSD